MPTDRITVFCFGASYACALVLELVQLCWPRPVQRWLATGFAGAGLLAHTLFLLARPPALASPFWSMLFLAWILAVFYLYGSVHHRRVAWGVFVLPVVLGLTVLAGRLDRPEAAPEASWWHGLLSIRGEAFWVTAHIGLLLLAAVGVCVGFVASVMYLVQAWRLKAKMLPGQGVRLLSLERLEAMNRRAVNLAFPLLTAGVLVGAALMLQRPDQLREWSDPKVWGAMVLWVVFAILFYLRYGVHVRGRRLALLTIMAFALLVFTLAAPHPVVQGGPP
ncbi:MAG TPA: cytochrome c biogenesis protein CcsA [Gemmataceae bacterium]|jgi:ABC-type transport system involved in cytochrome c biogenesis permease subunit|nr:cytochrome c biogenesis protein CcsA [Gemmataceae bacterium]